MLNCDMMLEIKNHYFEIQRKGIKIMKNEQGSLKIYFGKTTKSEEGRIVKMLKKIHRGKKMTAEFPATEYNKKEFPRVQSLLRFELHKPENVTIFGTLITDFVVTSDKIFCRLHQEAGLKFLQMADDELFCNPMRSKYSNLLFDLLKTEDFNKNMTGILREELCGNFNLNTQQKVSQFLMKLPQYIDELNQSGRLENIVTFSIDKEKGRRGHAPMKAIIFYFTTRKTVNKNAVKSPESDEKEISHSEIPTYTKKDETTLLCPFCGGKIVQCISSKGKKYECCEHSKYNIHVPNSERGNCNKYYKNLE